MGRGRGRSSEYGRQNAETIGSDRHIARRRRSGNGVAELKILAAEKTVTTIEVSEDKLRLVRSGDFITVGGRFPRLTKKEPKARLKEIKRLLLAL